VAECPECGVEMQVEYKPAIDSSDRWVKIEGCVAHGRIFSPVYVAANADKVQEHLLLSASHKVTCHCCRADVDKVVLHPILGLACEDCVKNHKLESAEMAAINCHLREILSE